MHALMTAILAAHGMTPPPETPPLRRYYASVRGPRVCWEEPLWATDFDDARRLAARLLDFPHKGLPNPGWCTATVDDHWDAVLLPGGGIVSRADYEREEGLPCAI